MDVFYSKTETKQWARLFDYVGRSLKNSKVHQLNETTESKIQSFFEWRLKARQTEELREFTHWLESECLSIDWRTDAYLRILDVPNVLRMEPGKPRFASLQTISLNKMLPTNLSKIVACFSKLIKSIPVGDLGYIPIDEAKNILKAGLKSKLDDTIKLAEDSREALLRAGHWSLTELDE